MSQLATPPLEHQNYAFFFDVDGTLAEIKPRPEQVFIPNPVIAHLQQLAVCSNQAVAVVSGRPVSELEKLTAPAKLTMAGVHGAERVLPDGQQQHKQIPAPLFNELVTRLNQALAKWPGCMLENKAMALAIHYRQAPEYEAAVLQLAEQLVNEHSELALQRGKCVVEIKPTGCDKGSAIAEFMKLSPFFNRIPVFIGDDLTDEAGFAQVNQYEGISVKVGEGETCARYRLADVASVHHWLGEQVRILS